MDPEVLIKRDGHLGQIVLNRPKAMNALTHGMVMTIASALEQWADDDGVSTILLSGAGERGLCAGGDIVAIYHDALIGGTDTAQFWADEYRLNALIARYPKPYVALMDGVVLGGGVGLSAHGSVRVVTERTKLGMPETGIGFVPDVGGTYLLARAPGELGTHLALTAGTMTGADAIVLGLADHFVESSKLPGLIDALAGTEAREAIQAFEHNSTPLSPLAAQRPWIDDCYASETVEEIVHALQLNGKPAARRASESILTKSPTALKVTLESLRRARRMGSLEEVLDQEYRVSLRFLEGSEFPEGVRAQVIDKDRSPRWAPASLAEVDPLAVAVHFADLGPRELMLAADVVRQFNR